MTDPKCPICGKDQAERAMAFRGVGPCSIICWKAAEERPTTPDPESEPSCAV